MADKIEEPTEGGLRYDNDKIRWDLVPPEIDEYVKVGTFGATKYTPRNWEKGMDWSRCWNSMMRHLWAWQRGERNDPESGLHHLAHAAWNVFALMVYDMRGIGKDDLRQEGDKKQPPVNMGGQHLTQESVKKVEPKHWKHFCYECTKRSMGAGHVFCILGYSIGIAHKFQRCKGFVRRVPTV